MTVGELVTQRMLIKARQCGSGGTTGPEQTIGRVLIAPQQALRSLGIWDAEVLEWHVGADFPLFDDMTEAFGKTLRIIVLPAKEE